MCRVCIRLCVHAYRVQQIVCCSDALILRPVAGLGPIAAGASPGGHHRAETGDKRGRSCNLRSRSIPCQEADAAAAAAGSCAAVRRAPTAVCLVRTDLLALAIVQQMLIELDHVGGSRVISCREGQLQQLRDAVLQSDANQQLAA